MSGKELLVDTNILLYLLKGNDTLEGILQGKSLYVSFLTELELIGYKHITEKEERQIAQVLNECLIVPLNSSIKQHYVQIRKQYHLKLPDAIVAATALSLNLPLITSDKQFRTVKELNLLYYEI